LPEHAPLCSHHRFYVRVSLLELLADHKDPSTVAMMLGIIEADPGAAAFDQERAASFELPNSTVGAAQQRLEDGELLSI
jgi:hypothetical protein